MACSINAFLSANNPDNVRVSCNGNLGSGVQFQALQGFASFAKNVAMMFTRDMDFNLSLKSNSFFLINKTESIQTIVLCATM